MLEAALLPRKWSFIFLFFTYKNVHLKIQTKKVEKNMMVLVHSHIRNRKDPKQLTGLASTH
jgi:hypothetical protein